MPFDREERAAREAADREAARLAKRAARLQAAEADGESSTLHRAKLLALEAVASKASGGSLPDFLAKVGSRVGAKFAQPLDYPQPTGDEVDAECQLVLVPDHQPAFGFAKPATADHGAAWAKGNAILALLASDTLSYILTLAGLSSFGSVALVCRVWRDAVQAKAREWGVLTYVKAIGGGYGKRKSQLDTPTWMSWLPASDPQLGLSRSPHLAIVDSCNYRISLMRVNDGTVSRVCARVGTEGSELLGEISQPSSICYDAESNCAYVVATVGVDDRRLLRYGLPGFTLQASSREGVGRTQLDAAEGIACSGGYVFIVDTARHRIAVYHAKGSLKSAAPKLHPSSLGVA